MSRQSIDGKLYLKEFLFLKNWDLHAKMYV